MLNIAGRRSTLATVLGVVVLAGSVLVAPPVLAQPDVCRVRNLDLHGEVSASAPTRFESR